jgi:AraC family transcriptional activator of tynA and feaB
MDEMMQVSDDFVGTTQLDFEGWRTFLRASCGNQPEVKDPSAFVGRVRPLRIWGLAATMLEVECGLGAADFVRNAYRSERTYRYVRSAGADYYYAVFQVAGRSVFTQNDKVAQLAVGDIALLDAARPAACVTEQSQWLRFQLPRASLVSHLGFEPQGGLYASGETPATRLLYDLVREADKVEGSGPVPADSYLQLAIYDLLGALFAPSISAPVSRYADQLFARVRGIVKDGFADPDFDPRRLAIKSGDIVALSAEALCRARFDLQRFHILAAFGSRRAPSPSSGVIGYEPAPERDRLRLWLSRLHSLRTQIPSPLRSFAGCCGPGNARVAGAIVLASTTTVLAAPTPLGHGELCTRDTISSRRYR